MTKILLVEDDRSLREIYGVRLLAEGYDIVSAADGEQALAMAIKDRPALIITDIMMPRISGFDMLDILRSTTETRDIKVIVMTALSSDDHRLRGEQMGADRYLVKSQVGIEDVVRMVHEVLGDSPAARPAGPPPAAATATPAAQPQQAIPVPGSMQQMAAPPTMQQLAGTPPAAAPQQPQRAPVPPSSAATATVAPALPPHDMPMAHSSTPPPASTRPRIIQPINDPAGKVDINELLDRELAKEAGIDMNNRPPIATTAQERAIVQNQLNTLNVAPPPPAPTIAIDPQGNVSMPGAQQQPRPVTPPPPVQSQQQGDRPAMPPAPRPVGPPQVPPRPPEAPIV